MILPKVFFSLTCTLTFTFSFQGKMSISLEFLLMFHSSIYYLSTSYLPFIGCPGVIDRNPLSGFSLPVGIVSGFVS